MIFLLDIILAVNLLTALRYFKSVVSPAVLMGSGFMAASLMATSYYMEWHMDRMLPISVFIIGGGTCFFTICCMFFSNLIPAVNTKKTKVINYSLNIERVRLLLKVSIAIGCIGCILKLYYMIKVFGSLGLAELIVSVRQDNYDLIGEFNLPSYVRQMGSYTIIISYFTLWLLAFIIVYKNNKLSTLKKIIYIHIGVAFFNGMLTGTKTPILGMIMHFFVLYIYIYYSYRGNYTISKKIYQRFFIVLFLLALSFRTLSMVIGRSVEDRTNSDLLAEYCGAQIKNFDIFMHTPYYTQSNKWGENTFPYIYAEIDKKYEKEKTDFQFIGNERLGNVYTQYRQIYDDFGIYGVFGICCMIALFSTFVYKKSKKALFFPEHPNVYLYIYTTMTMPIFMSFFSSRFTEVICNFGWLRSVLYLNVMVWFLNRYIFIDKNTYNKNYGKR